MTEENMTGDVAPERDLALATRAGLPEDLTLLLARYPREVWEELARQKRLLSVGHGIYELPPE